jgi:hypothetical protein
MTIKTKLSLGLGFLFLIIFALAAFCSNLRRVLKKLIEDIEDYKSSTGKNRYNPERAGQ